MRGLHLGARVHDAPASPPPGGSIDFFTMDAIVIRFLFQGLLCFLIFSGGPLCNMVAVMFNITLVVKKRRKVASE
jgi:hypothetical protein